MRTAMVLSLICLTGYATTAVAQQTPAKPRHARHAATGIKLADVSGTWAMENTVKTAAGNDTTVTSELVASATRKGWTTNFPGRDPIPTRVVARQRGGGRTDHGFCGLDGPALMFAVASTVTSGLKRTC